MDRTLTNKLVKILFCTLTLLFAAFLPGESRASGGRVANLKVYQEGRDVVLTYDLEAEDPSKKEEVIFEVSTDGGTTWKSPKGAWGDAGKGVRPGRGKKIRWSVLEEFPRGFDEDVRFRVVTRSELEGGPGPARTFTIKGVSFKMVRIPAGEFMMGSPSHEPGRDNDERQHRVRISQDFWLGETEVTQGLWKAVTGNNPSYFKSCGDDCPVENVSWNDCQEFIRRLNNAVRGVRFRLPTEAEWEYACRAGTTGPYAGHLDAMGWYDKNSGRSTHGSGQKRPNAWGLYDMHGNVWEWCQDWYGDYPSGYLNDPTGPPSGSDRVLRGGSWRSLARYCRSASRHRADPADRDGNLGFRLALSPGQ